MKISFLTAYMSNRAAGVWGAIQGNSRALMKLGVECGVIGLSDPLCNIDSDQKNSFEYVRACRVVRSNAFGYSPEMRPALREERPDLVHANGLWLYPSVASSKWHRESGRPYLIQPHGMLDAWAVRNSAWKKRIAGFLYEHAHLRRAACIHVLNDSEAIAVRKFGLTNPICVVPNGIGAPIRCDDKPGWLGASGQRQRRLLFLGRIHPQKGLPALLHAWAAVGQAARDWELIVAGWSRGNHERDLKRQVQELEITDAIRFIGPQFGRAKAATYCSVDAFVLPSLSEGLPMAVLEAWSYGLPVLMTSACNLPIGFDSGAAIEIGNDALTIANGLRKLMGMLPSELRTIGKCGQKLAVDRFSWRNVATEIRAVYDWILVGGTPPSCVITS